MTRTRKLALVTLLAGLLSLVPVSIVNADSSCTGVAREHCEEMAALGNDAPFRASEVANPTHRLPANGLGQEHFEAMSVVQPDRFIIAVASPTGAAPYLGTAHEQDEQRFLEEKWSEEQRFLEVNTIGSGAWASTYMEAVTPLPGQDR